jgi:ArsR family transcriptional regulator, arsenate/arsenite/antimonite-responsive transcriptional repressor
LSPPHREQFLDYFLLDGHYFPGYNTSESSDMKTATVSRELLDFLKSVASESRMKILLLFMDGQERTVNQISEQVELEQSTTSEHLAIMKRNGLLISRKSGKEVYYQPDRDRIIQLLNALNQLLSKCC